MSDNNKYKPKKIGKKKKLQKNKPTIPTGWDIIDDNGTPKLFFYRNDKVITEIEVAPETMNDLMVELSEHIITDNNIADSWTYREPADTSLPDYLTLLKDGKILATLPVDSIIGKKLGKSFNKYVEKVPLKKRINKLRTEKPKRFYSSAFLIALVAGVLLYNIFVNIILTFFPTISQL